LRNFAFAVAIGRKADMPFCTAYCLLMTQSGHTDSATFLPLAIDPDHRPILADGKTLDVAQNLLSSNTQHVRSYRFKCLCISATLPFRFIFLRRWLAFGLSLFDNMIASASGLHRKIFGS
jgi:hypothetical protein